MLNHAGELVGVTRVGGVAAGGQPSCESAGILSRLCRRHISRAAANQLGVVTERICVRIVGAEFIHQFARHAVDVFRGQHIDGFARPITTGLDAKKITRIGAVSALDFVFAPACFQRSLTHDKISGHAQRGHSGAAGPANNTTGTADASAAESLNGNGATQQLGAPRQITQGDPRIIANVIRNWVAQK